MNKSIISNTLRSLGLLYPFDKLRYRVEKRRNAQDNLKFKESHPDVTLPPDYLMYESFQMNYNKYYYGGQKTAQSILEQISKHIDIQGKKILDWGCGPARIIRHMPAISNNVCEFYGTDYNLESINWCQNNIKDIAFNHNNLEAKLPYQDGFFNGLYGISIFTHLSEGMHYNWFAELKRIINKDGIILITTQGNNFKTKMSADELENFNNGQLVVRGQVKEGHRTYSAFHPDAFMERLFKEVEVLEKIVISPEGKSYTPQDTWIVRI